MPNIPGGEDRKSKLLARIQEFSMAKLGFNRDEYDPKSDGLTASAIGAIIHHAIKRGDIYDDENGLLWRSGYGPKAIDIPVGNLPKSASEPMASVTDWMMPGLQMTNRTVGEIPSVISQLPPVKTTVTAQGMNFIGYLYYSTQSTGGNWQLIREHNYVLCRDNGVCPKQAYRLENAKRMKVAIRKGTSDLYEVEEANIAAGYELWVLTETVK